MKGRGEFSDGYVEESDKQTAKTSQQSSSQASHDAEAEGFVLKNRMMTKRTVKSDDSAKTSVEQAVPHIANRDKKELPGTNQGGDVTSYVKMEQRYTSMEERIQKMLYLIGFLCCLCVILCGFALHTWMNYGIGCKTIDGSPVQDPKINEVQEDLHSIKGNIKDFQTFKADIWERLKSYVDSEHDTMRQEWNRNLLFLEKINEEHVKQERENRTSDVKNVQSKITLMEDNIQSMENDIQSKDEDIRNKIKNVHADVKSVQTTMVNSIGDIRITIDHHKMVIDSVEDKIGSIGSSIEDAKMQVEHINRAREETEKVLTRTREIQEIIHQNTFDKGAMIAVLLLIIISLVGLGFYVCVHRPWNPKDSSRANASEAQQALDTVPTRPVLGSSVCIISFKSNRIAEYGTLVSSALGVGSSSIVYLITRHADIPGLPHCKMYIMCVEFSERHVIIEEPGLALGDMKRTTYSAVKKMGGALVILYVNHRGSQNIPNLYHKDIYCVSRQPELQQLEQRNRFISTYDQLNDSQKAALKQAVTEALG